MDEAVIDGAVRHILTVKERMGLFEHPEKTGVPGCIGCQEHQQAALTAARRSVTMLKNNGVLLSRKRKKSPSLAQTAMISGHSMAMDVFYPSPAYASAGCGAALYHHLGERKKIGRRKRHGM
jgi:beta-glucosidase